MFLRSFLAFLVVILLFWLVADGSGRLPQAPLPSLDLVLAYVTVTAEKSNTAPRLSVRDFRIFEDNKEQKIEYFLVQDQPVTVGIVWAAPTGFDCPPPDLDLTECPKVFMRNMPPGSEYFLLQGDKITTSFTTDVAKLPSNFAWSSGATDGIYIGFDVLKEAAYPRKMLLLIGDARGTEGQLQPTYVERVAIELSSGAQSTQVHTLNFSVSGIDVDHPASIFLSEVVDLTGGSYNMVQPFSVNCGNLAKELRVQYLIGYRPTNGVKDGKWRTLKVDVASPGNGPKLKARVKRGYYAAKQGR